MWRETRQGLLEVTRPAPRNTPRSNQACAVRFQTAESIKRAPCITCIMHTKFYSECSVAWILSKTLLGAWHPQKQGPKKGLFSLSLSELIPARRRRRECLGAVAQWHIALICLQQSHRPPTPRLHPLMSQPTSHSAGCHRNRLTFLSPVTSHLKRLIRLVVKSQSECKPYLK